MTFTVAGLDASLALLREFDGVDLAGLPRAELLRVQEAAAEGRRAWDVALAHIAGEVARRSTPQEGPSGLARREGFASPEQLVASMIGAPVSEGKRLVSAGKVLCPDAATPERERHPHVAQALRDGGLTVGKAQLITDALAGLTGDTSELESRLVRSGRTHTYAQLRLICTSEAARFDAVQLEDREKRQHDQRYLAFSEDTSGLTRISGLLDPPAAIAIRTFVDAQVKAAFHARHAGTDADTCTECAAIDHSAIDHAGHHTDDGTQRGRTAGQIRLDALTALAMHGLDCDHPATGVKATIIVRIDRDDLERDIATATCDAITTPISVSMLRHVAVNASILPMVMDSQSRVLDCGREQRLFDWYQRMAIAQRDKGCVKCHAPISHCITHHIRWWSRDGRTDMRNAVLLCVRCHTDLHHQGWDIHVDHNNHVWLTPPPDIDPLRRPQLAGPAALHT